MTELRPFAITKAPASGAVNAEAILLSKRPTRPQANEVDDRMVPFVVYLGYLHKYNTPTVSCKNSNSKLDVVDLRLLGP